MNQISIFEQAGMDIPEGLIDNKVNTIFKATGLNWEVKQKLVYSQEIDEITSFGVPRTYSRIPNLVANYRSDNGQYLGMVHPKDYKVVQNVEAFDFIDELPNFTFEKVGMFNGGKKVFVVGKSNEQIDIDGSGDLVNFYLTFLHGHDGKSGIRFIFAPVRLYCLNQFNLMLKTATFKYNIAHTGNIDLKISQIQKYIADGHLYVKALETEVKSMINTKLVTSVNSLLDLIIPVNDEETTYNKNKKQKAKDTILNLYNNKDDLQNYKNTQFGLISAISDFVSHLTPVRKNADINNRFIQNLEGDLLLNNAYTILKAA